MVDVDLKGFASVMLNTLSDSGRYGHFGGKGCAIISKIYMNFNSRLAYHFSTVDAYCSGTKNNNNPVPFMGGSCSSERKMAEGPFHRRGPAKPGRGRDEERYRRGSEKYGVRGIEQKLDYLGRLMCCARQLDMAMYSENVMRLVRSGLYEGELRI